jgi:hypothetical protein
MGGITTTSKPVPDIIKVRSATDAYTLPGSAEPQLGIIYKIVLN